MVVNLPPAPEFDTGQLKEALGKKVIEALKLDEILEALAKKTPEVFQAKLMQMRDDYQAFYNVDGTIKLQELQERLSFQERMALFASHFLSENVVKLFFSGDKSKNVRKVSFAEARDYFDRRKTADIKVKDGHLIWLTTNPFSQIQMFFSLAEFFQSEKKEGEELFPLPPQSRMVLNVNRPSDGPRMTPTRFAILKAIAEKYGIRVSLFNPGKRESDKSLSKPAADEIQVVFAPPEGLPLEEDGTIDREQLAWFKDLYEQEGVPTQWVLTGRLLAAIYVLQGQPVEDALRFTGVQGTERVFGEKSIQELLDGLKEPSAPAATPAVAASEAPTTAPVTPG